MSFDEVLDLGTHLVLKNDFAFVLVYGYGYEGVSAHSIARHLFKDVRAASRWVAANQDASTTDILVHLAATFTSSLRSFNPPPSTAAPTNMVLLVNDLIGCVERASLYGLNRKTTTP